MMMKNLVIFLLKNNKICSNTGLSQFHQTPQNTEYHLAKSSPIGSMYGIFT